jgi:hypothetical protein
MGRAAVARYDVSSTIHSDNMCGSVRCLTASAEVEDNNSKFHKRLSVFQSVLRLVPCLGKYSFCTDQFDLHTR